MREKSAADLVTALTKRDCLVHIDPIFLLSADTWRKLCVPIKEKKYVLIYMVGMGHIVDEMIAFAKTLAQQKGLDLLFMNTEYIPYLYSEVKHIKTVAPDHILMGPTTLLLILFMPPVFQSFFISSFILRSAQKRSAAKKMVG